MYHFIPINDPLFHQLFPARVNFRPSKGPFILGLISIIRLHTMAYFACGPNSASGYSRRINLLGCFHSVIKYGLLTARYGRAIKQTISTLARLRPIL